MEELTVLKYDEHFVSREYCNKMGYVGLFGCSASWRVLWIMWRSVRVEAMLTDTITLWDWYQFPDRSIDQSTGMHVIILTTHVILTLTSHQGGPSPRPHPFSPFSTHPALTL